MDGERAAAQIEELTRWVTSADARSAAHAELARLALPHDPARIDDVLAHTFERVWNHLRRSPVDGSVVAYARRSLTNAALDLFAVPMEVPLDALLTDPEAPDEPHGPSAEAIDRESLERIRRTLQALLAAPRVKDWYVAASLAVVVLTDEPDRKPAADIPRPHGAKGGAANPILWAALAYAGQDRCFDKPDKPAVRERRSKAIAQVQRTLVRALAVDTAPEPERVP